MVFVTNFFKAKPEANPNPIAKASNSFKEISRQLYLSWGLVVGP
jgi:hypothetical protein